MKSVFDNKNLLLICLILSSAIHFIFFIIIYEFNSTSVRYSIIHSAQSIEVEVKAKAITDFNSNTSDKEKINIAKMNIKITDKIDAEILHRKSRTNSNPDNYLKQEKSKFNISSENLQGSITDAKPISHLNQSPIYPQIARIKGWEGVVFLEVLVEKNGTVGRINLEKSSGFNILDESALKTIKDWKFEPAQQGSKKLSSIITIPVEFKLMN